MNLLVRQVLDVFKDWTDGPWRSKSVLVAVVMVVAGVGFWFYGLKSSTAQSEVSNAATNVAMAALPNAPGHATGSNWNWREPFPFYVPMGASYVAGFCVGWLFRRLMRMVAVVGALLIGLLALGRFAGFNTTHTQTQVKHSRRWAQHELKTTSDYLESSLPWTVTGGFGAFLGFRRRRKMWSHQPTMDS